MKIQIFILLFTFYASIVQSVKYTIPTCNSTSILSYLQMKCYYCNPNNFIRPSIDQKQCICMPGYIPKTAVINSLNLICIKNYTNSNCSNSNQAFDNLDINGSYKSNFNCINCNASQGYILNYYSTPQCKYCGPNMNVQGNSCSCNTDFTRGVDGCYNIKQYKINSNKYDIQTSKALVGCYQHKDQLSCSFLMNLCVFTLLDTSTGSLCASLNLQNQTQLFLSGNSFSLSVISTPLKIKLVRYLPTGNYVDWKDLTNADISFCGIGNNELTFKIGTNFQYTCSYNFNNILNSLGSNTFTNYTTNYVYSMMIIDDSGNYQFVPAYINGNSVSRFFIIDTFSWQYTSQLTYLSSLEFLITLNSEAKLILPKLILTYNKLSTLNSDNTFDNPIKSLFYSFSYGYDITNYNKTILGIFIAINFVVLIHVLIRTYVAYLNKRSVLTFFLFLIQTWSTYMFLLLLVVSGYWFFFTKITPSIYVIMPKDQGFYVAFYVVFSIMIFFRLIATFYQKSDSLKSQVYIIDWQKNIQKNSWRHMFIINSLNKFYTSRTISFFWILAWSLFFLVGLNWQMHSIQVTALNLSNINISPMNPVLLYFLGTSILVAVFIVIKSLRRISVIWWPYPFEDFLDFCCLANLSIFFAKRNYPMGYYLHASSPIKSQSNFKQINQILTKGLKQKNRNFLTQTILQTNNFQSYIVYLNNDFENKLTQIRRTEDSSEFQPIKTANQANKQSYKKIPFNIREDFAQKYIKRLLMNITGQRNQLTQKTLFQSLLGVPPINLHQVRQLPYFQSDKQIEMHSLFPNSNQFRDIGTFIMVFNMFNILTSSSAISAFLTYLLLEILVQKLIQKYARINIQRFTKVKEGFMI